MKWIKADYDLFDEYLLINPSDEFKSIVSDVLKEIKRDGVFNKYGVGLEVKYQNGHGYLAEYVYGSASQGTIKVLIDESAHKKAVEQYNPDGGLYDAVKSTIAHEYFHGLQDMYDQELDEDEAEGFAFDYTMWGKLSDIPKEWLKNEMD